MTTFIRFVCFQTVERQRNRLGVFQAISIAERADDAPPWALAELRQLEAWFAAYLSTPEKLTSGRRRYLAPDDRQHGLSWFKPEAVEHVTRMHRLKTALEACGVHVEVLTTRDPGKVIWEDAHQVVAEPGPRRF